MPDNEEEEMSDMQMKSGEMNFLIVDDDDLLRLTTKNILLSLACTNSIKEASNGRQALEILKKPDTQPIDIVLCDLNMPEMDGMEFIRHLGESRLKVSLVIVSSHDDTLLGAVRKMATAYNVRLLGAVQKPVSRERLEHFIKEHKPAQPAKSIYKSDKPAFTLDEILQGIGEKQFEPFYQPKVSLKTGAISGAEALARWIHPDRGIIAPYAFIETLEKSGNIDGLTFLMLEKAATGCRLLHDRGHAVSVSVNLSLSSLTNVLLADKITQIVQSAGINPKYIILEVTESSTMTEVASSLENLARLRMRGFGLSIDDYGTGSSNIQQMTRVAFSELKIDQSFVRNCTDNEELCIVVRSSIEMAHRLKISCIAEGVETQQDWLTLKEMDCDTAQGYFIAKPMDLSSFLNFCATYRPKLLA